MLLKCMWEMAHNVHRKKIMKMMHTFVSWADVAGVIDKIIKGFFNKSEL